MTPMNALRRSLTPSPPHPHPHPLPQRRRAAARGRALALLVLAAAAGGAAGQSVTQIWTTNCARCHGAGGEGANASSLLDGEYVSDGSDRGLFEAVRNGQEEFGMPAFAGALSDAEAWATVNYIRELQERARRERVPPPGRGGGVVESQRHAYRFETVVESGLRTPWSIDFLPDGRALVTERGGNLRVLSQGRLSPPVRGTPRVWERGQGGMLDVAPHPGFAENGWIYLAFSEPSPDGRASMTKVVRGRVTDDLRWTDEQTIFDSPEELDQPTAIHFGCRIVFDGSGHVFFGIGERGRAEQAQDLARPNGKIHRVREDGSVPEDNPFVDREGAMPTIWSYGHRNPQGLAFDGAGRLWETEHGPRGGDELNLIERGKNYGWPLVSHGINYNGAPLTVPWPDVAGVEEEIAMPAFVWLPSTAACGLDVHRGDAFPEWNGDLFSGGLAGEIVERLRIEDGRVVEREEVFREGGRVRDVVVSPEGYVYIVLNGPDRVIRLVPADD